MEEIFNIIIKKLCREMSTIRETFISFSISVLVLTCLLSWGILYVVNIGHQQTITNLNEIIKINEVKSSVCSSSEILAQFEEIKERQVFLKSEGLDVEIEEVCNHPPELESNHTKEEFIKHTIDNYFAINYCRFLISKKYETKLKPPQEGTEKSWRDFLVNYGTR